MPDLLSDTVDVDSDGQYASNVLEKKNVKAFLDALTLANVSTGANAATALMRLIVDIQELETEDIISIVDKIKKSDGDIIAIDLYTIWLWNPFAKKVGAFAVWYNLGVHQFSAGQYQKAAVSYRNALKEKTDLYQAVVNLGLSLEAHGQIEEALEVWHAAIQPKDAQIAILNHIARVSENKKLYDEASNALYRSLSLNSRQPDAIQHWVGLRLKTCSWPIYLNDMLNISSDYQKSCTGSLNLLALFDDIEFQLKINAEFVRDKYAAVPALLPHKPKSTSKRIRIGYLSSDFCRHPMTYLISELIEKHDRNRFEIFGYCATIDDASSERNRIVNAFDHFTPIINISDERAAIAIHKDEIDILVDLNGLTLGTRINILRWRPAPIQMTYLGYNGPVPMEEIDYIIADDYVIPKEYAYLYRPKPLYIEGCYQVNDRMLAIAPVPSRKEVGLPYNSFVYCCFSNTYKITIEMFQLWMVIMSKSPSAVLWLFVDNKWARDNLKKVAAAYGLFDDRLIFAERVEPSLYRARLALADLFLDTFPYNAGTTASDALRVGLPIVSLSGQSFVSRMAGSLLREMGLQELIAGTKEEYVSIATSLYNNKYLINNIKSKLTKSHWEGSIGNSSRFVERLENAFDVARLRQND